jgi:hypothetical protein
MLATGYVSTCELHTIRYLFHPALTQRSFIDPLLPLES